MLSFNDYIRGACLSMSNALNFFPIHHHEVLVYRNGNVEDVTYKIKSRTKLPKNLHYSSFLNIKYVYQLYYKETNKYYILITTLSDIINHTVNIPKDEPEKPRSLTDRLAKIYVNGNELTMRERIYYKNHHPDNTLFYVFKFNDIHISNIIIKKNDEIIKIYDKNFEILTLRDIIQYL